MIDGDIFEPVAPLAESTVRPAETVVLQQLRAALDLVETRSLRPRPRASRSGGRRRSPVPVDCSPPLPGG
jgi:hypothetical protein